MFMGIYQSIICTGGICVFYACFNQKKYDIDIEKPKEMWYDIKAVRTGGGNYRTYKKVSEPIDYRPALPCYKKRFSGA